MVPKKKVPLICRSLFYGNDQLIHNTKRTIASGENVSLWKDWWCGEKPIIQIMYVNPDLLDLTVKDIITISGGWDKDKISILVPVTLLLIFSTLPFPLHQIRLVNLLGVGKVRASLLYLNAMLLSWKTIIMTVLILIGNGFRK